MVIVLVAIVLLGKGATDDGTHVVQTKPIAFNLRYPSPMREVKPAAGELLHLQRKGLDDLIVEPLSIPPYEGDVGGALPILAARELDALKKHFPDLEPVEEGKTRINRAAGYALVFRASRKPRMYGRLVLLPEPVPGARDRREAAAAGHAQGRRRQGDRRRRVRPAQDALPQLPVRDRGAMTEIDFDQFLAVDMRVGRIVKVEDFPEARKPAWKLTIDFGEELGLKKSSAQITNYRREELEGRLIVAVVNFPPRQIGPVRSEVLTLGAADEEGRVILLGPGSDVPLGARIH